MHRKRDEKFERKSHERDIKAKHTESIEHLAPIHERIVKRVKPSVDTQADFLSFNDVDMDKFTKKNKTGLELLGSCAIGDSLEDIETRISRKFDRD